MLKCQIARHEEKKSKPRKGFKLVVVFSLVVIGVVVGGVVVS